MFLFHPMSSSDLVTSSRSSEPRTPTELDESGDEVQRRVLQHTLEEIQARQQEGPDCCVICLEAVSEACEALPCKHRHFDYLCLVSWLQQSPLCPLCKATVSQVRYGFDDGNEKLYNVPQPKPPAPGDPRTDDSNGQRIAEHESRSRNYFLYGRASRPRRNRHAYGRPYPRRRDENEDADPVNLAISRRREVYRNNRYSKHVGSNRLSRYRELTPALFCTDEELTSRARMWIRRELQVFSFLTLDETDTSVPRPEDHAPRTAVEQRRANNAEFLLEYIVAILKSVDVMGSAGQAEEMLADFLGRDNARLFLHELRAWLRSPYTRLEDWDRNVQYDEATQAPDRRSETEREQTTSREVDRIARNNDLGRDRRLKGDFYRPHRAGRVERRSSSYRHGSSSRRVNDSRGI